MQPKQDEGERCSGQGHLETLGSDNFNTRLVASAVLCGAGDETRYTLIHGLTHPEGTVRARCALLLGEWGDERHAAPLLVALSDNQVSVRRALIHALYTLARDIPNVCADITVALAD